MNLHHQIKQYLRPMKSKALVATEASIERRACPDIATYDNIVLIPLGQCLDENNRYDRTLIFEDTGYCAKVSPYTDKKFSYDTIIYGGFIRSKWGHFITESIARLWATQIPAADNDSPILFFSDRAMEDLSGNFLELFKLLGISERVIIENNPVSVRHLIVPEPGYEHDIYYTDEQSRVYRKIIESALDMNVENEQTVYDSVFLSRASVPGAQHNAINLAELEEYFAKNGFKVIAPENITLSHLIRIMNSAHHIATISGTPAHNFAFINEASNKHLTIIERHGWVNSFQISLNLMCKLPVTFVDSYYLPRLSSSQDSLMLFAPTLYFREFATDHSFSDGGEFVSSDRNTRRKEFRTFLRRYRRYWCSGDGMCSWEIESGATITEAVLACRERYPEWAHESLPVMWYDYLSPRASARLLKRALEKLLPFKEVVSTYLRIIKIPMKS